MVRVERLSPSLDVTAIPVEAGCPDVRPLAGEFTLSAVVDAERFPPVVVAPRRL